MDRSQPTLLRFYAQFVRKYAPFFMFFFLLGTAKTLLDTLSPYFFKWIIDGFTESGETPSFERLLIPISIYVGALFASDCLSRLSDYLEMQRLPRLLGKMRKTIFKQLLKHSHRFYQEEMVGKLTSKIFDITRGFDELYYTFYQGLFPITLSFAGSAFLMWRLNPMFAVSLIIWYGAFLSISAFLSIRNIPLVEAHSETLSRLFGKIVDSLSNISTVRFFSGQAHEIKEMAQLQNLEIKQLQRTDGRVLALRFFQGLFSNLLMLFFFYLLFLSAKEGTVSAGDFIFIVQSAFSLIRTSVWTADRIAKTYRIFGSAKQAYKMMQVPIEIKDKPDAKPILVPHGRITFDDVSFAYSNRLILDHLSLEIQPGEKVGIVGFSGSGKTTFVNLLLRLFEIQKGIISIDGQNIQDVSQESLRQKIAIIPQDPVLFHRNLLENIRYGSFHATDGEVIEAAKIADCHSFIMNIPEQYHALVGERGIKLSQGQRQRIAIARALIKNAPILILDEATSALDSMTEKRIQESLNHLMQGRTVIAIAHRLSTLLGMDRILVFSEGKMIESGSHEELLALNGQYAKLWQIQFLGENVNLTPSH
ncbi:MAG: putative transporter, ATPase and permease component [Chlamydiales bacterium]|jgi:ATP-binding cassette subfamily B protein|nr:putative transporter, ATPase and permease component [Chlamydiales bacterium]